MDNYGDDDNASGGVADTADHNNGAHDENNNFNKYGLLYMHYCCYGYGYVYLHSSCHWFLQDLEMMNLNGMGPNFHKLQVFSNNFEDLIDETPTFGYMLRCIKVSISYM